ncbi:MULTISPECIES: hypothetical protein [unclassified Streptomyces]|uniref:hypothetical protein n=1 Tax=unclassified Streptomyces TaxID=2593676 RepID=UPI0033F96B05
MFGSQYYSVTWPVKPEGLVSRYFRAASPDEAVQASRDLYVRMNDGYTIDYTAEPEVWLLRRPYGVRSKHVQGPCYDDRLPATPH